MLIAKVNGAKDIKEFRPINMMSCIYKLISKVLTKRLSEFLGKVIGKRQHAFLEDKNSECCNGGQ